MDYLNEDAERAERCMEFEDRQEAYDNGYQKGKTESEAALTIARENEAQAKGRLENISECLIQANREIERLYLEIAKLQKELLDARFPGPFAQPVE